MAIKKPTKLTLTLNHDTGTTKAAAKDKITNDATLKIGKLDPSSTIEWRDSPTAVWQAVDADLLILDAKTKTTLLNIAELVGDDFTDKTLDYRQVSAEGIASDASSFKFTYDTASPKFLEVISPDIDSILNGKTSIVRFTSNEQLSGFDAKDFTFSDPALATIKSIKEIKPTTPNGEWAYDVTISAAKKGSGEVSLYFASNATATDNAGNDVDVSHITSDELATFWIGNDTLSVSLVTDTGFSFVKNASKDGITHNGDIKLGAIKPDAIVEFRIKAGSASLPQGSDGWITLDELSVEGSSAIVDVAYLYEIAGLVIDDMPVGGWKDAFEFHQVNPETYKSSTATTLAFTYDVIAPMINDNLAYVDTLPKGKTTVLHLYSNEQLQGVDKADFTLNDTSVASIKSVSKGKFDKISKQWVYDVTVLANKGAISSTTTLKLADNASITDLAGNAVKVESNSDKTAPNITSPAEAAPINENSGTTQVVYTVTSDDADGVVYSLKSNGDEALLRIDAATGAVTLIDNPDYEEKSSYAFTVVATDAAGNFSEKTVMLAINDVRENNNINGTAGDDVISYPVSRDDFTISSLAGNDTITTASGNDVVRAGDGADTIQTGAGNDIIVVVGQTSANQYTQDAITNAGGTGLDLSSVLTLADLNGRVTSEIVSGESIDGGTGTNRLVIYGNVDLSGATLANVSQIQVNSTLSLTAQQLNTLPVRLIFGDGESVLNILNDDTAPVTVDLSGIGFIDFKTLNIGQGVTLIVDQSDVSSLHYITGEGSLQASTASSTLALTGKYISLDVKDKEGVSDATHGGGIYVEGDILIGTESADTFNGSALGDRIEGGAGNDTLNGEDGNDIIRGGAGVDTMEGGAGDDRFIIVGDISGGGKIDSAADTEALGFPLTDLNGKNLNEDEDGAVEIIRGGDGEDTLYVYGTADLSNYDITGIEHIEIRSHVTFSTALLEKVKSVTGDGSSTIVLYGGTAADPLMFDLTGLDSATLKNIGEIVVGENVVLKIADLSDLGGARILTGDGKIETTASTLDLSNYTRTKGLDIVNASGSSISGGEVIDHVISGNGLLVEGSDGDDYLVGKETDEMFYTRAGTDVISGKGGNDEFFISGNGSKTIIDTEGKDTLNLSLLGSSANVDLTNGGTVGGAVISLGSGAAAAGKAPLDLFIVEDLSGSFSDDVYTVRGLLDNLVSEVRTMQPDSRFGAGSFVDKPKYPFGYAPSGDYVYRTDSALSSDVTKVKAAFDNMLVLDGYDIPESQLEALYQVALRTIQDDTSTTTSSDEIGFRNSAMRFVVLATDARYHVAGDNSGAGANNGDTVLDGTPPGSGEDYPSVAQVKDALLKANIYPVFAVTSGNESTYGNLVTQLGRGDVVNLSSNSSNLINSIKTSVKDYKVDFIENIIGTTQNDTLTGNGLDNRIDGGNSNDIISGLVGNDTLNGGVGDDTLNGGDGNDTLNGGLGNDIVVLRGVESDYEFTAQDNAIIIKGISGEGLKDGTDTVDRSVETIKFASGSDMLVSAIAEEPLIKASELFSKLGYYTTFAEMASASYSDGKASFDKLSNVDGFKWITNEELGISEFGSYKADVFSIFSGMPFYDQFTELSYGYNFSNGIYEAVNARASIGLTSDAIYFSFAGTDDKDDAIINDLFKLIGGFDAYYKLFTPLIDSINTYVNNHENIKHVYVSGHSLGGAMVEKFMADHPTSDVYEAVTFEGAPYGNVKTDNFDERLTQFEFSKDPVPDLGTNSGHVVNVSNIIPDDIKSWATDLLNTITVQYHRLPNIKAVVEYFDKHEMRFNTVAADLFNDERVYLPFDFSTKEIGAGEDEIDLATILTLFITGLKTATEAYIVVGSGGAVAVSDAVVNAIDSMAIAIDLFEGVTESTRTIITNIKDDIAMGGNNVDVIFGGDGNDYLTGKKGDDIIHGGSGDDIIDEPNKILPNWLENLSTLKESILADVELKSWLMDIKDKGVDELLSSSIDLILPKSLKITDLGKTLSIANGLKGLATDLVIGKAIDKIGDGLEELFSWRNAGNDTLIGGDGNDVYFVNTKNDKIEEYNLASSGTMDTIVLTGNSGAKFDATFYDARKNVEAIIAKDDVWTKSENFSIRVDDEQGRYLIGNAGNNTLIGNVGSDVLVGGADKDWLVGGAGNDVLIGGKYDSVGFSGMPSDLTDLIGKYADAFGVDNHDVSYLYGGQGNDYIYGDEYRFSWPDGDYLPDINLVKDNDYFFVDVDVTNNTDNWDTIYNMDTVNLPDFSLNGNSDYIVFSASQLGVSLDDLDAVGLSEQLFNGISGDHHLSSGNYMDLNSIADYKVNVGSPFGLYDDYKPQFIFDETNADLYFDQDGSHDVGDQVLLVHFVNMSSITLMGADDILIMESFPSGYIF